MNILLCTKNCKYTIAGKNLVISRGTSGRLFNEELRNVCFSYEPQIMQTNGIVISSESGRVYLEPEDGIELFGWEMMNNVFDKWISKVKFIDISELDTSEAATLLKMFHKCESLEKVVLGAISFKNMFSLQYMFQHCTNLKEVDFSHVQGMENVVLMNGIFEDCTLLKKVIFPNVKKSKVRCLNSAFLDCLSLEEVNMKDFILSSRYIRTIESMFANCHSLKSIDFGESVIPERCKVSHAFMDCPALESFSAKNLFIKDGVSDMFTGCSNLRTIDLSSVTMNTLIGEGNNLKMCNSIREVKLYDGTIYFARNKNSES